MVFVPDIFFEAAMNESDDEERRFTKNLGPYPRKDLRMARRSFLESWTEALYRNPTVQSIHEAHRRFPPTIRMINYLDYPFQDEFNHNWMPVSQEMSIKKDEHVRGPVVTGPRKKYKSIDFYSRFLREKSDARKVAVLAPIPAKPTMNITFYTCDNCPYESVLKNHAVEHLKSSRHNSCSQCSYAKCDDEEGNRIAVIVSPREVKNELDFNNGWKKRDTTSVCPVCDLLLPDKVRCTFFQMFDRVCNLLHEEFYVPFLEFGVADKLFCSVIFPCIF